MDGSLCGAGQVVCLDLPAPVVCVIWAAGGPGQDCDVRPVAMPPGYSWTPTPSQRTSVNVGNDPVPPWPTPYPAGWWAGVTPAVGIGSWRSRRSTPERRRAACMGKGGSVISSEPGVAKSR